MPFERSSPQIIRAENRNVSASSHSAGDSMCRLKYGTCVPRRMAKPASNVYTRPPSGRVPYVVISPIELALASCERGTMFGIDASFAGVHRSERHSMTNDSPKIAHSVGMNGIDA